MDTTIDLEKIHAEIGKLIAETGKLNAERQKLDSEAGKLAAERAKLLKEAFLYPVIVASALIGAVATITASVIKYI